MTQYVYILKEKEKSKGWNPPREYKGDYPPLRYVATTGPEMVQVLVSVWKENKLAKYVVFDDGTNEVKFEMKNIPAILSKYINESNLSKTALGWLLEIKDYDNTIKK
jgi:hypothetical protein